jgi:hypothetical protein
LPAPVLAVAVSVAVLLLAVLAIVAPSAAVVAAVTGACAGVGAGDSAGAVARRPDVLAEVASARGELVTFTLSEVSARLAPVVVFLTGPVPEPPLRAALA